MLEQDQIISLSALLTRLLRLKDSNFSNFLNSDPTILRVLLNSLLSFTSSASASVSCSETQSQDLFEINQLHHLFFKFLLRQCPTFNSLYKKELKSPTAQTQAQDTKNSPILKAVRPPKRFLNILFESDPLGLLFYLYNTWHHHEPKLLCILRDELIPQTLLDKFKAVPIASKNDLTIKFISWLTDSTSIKSADLNPREKENIIKRFEYESDDDMVEEDGQQDTQNSNLIEELDPIQIHLLTTYISNPTIFSRTSACRSSTPRKELLQQSKLSHEQVEGWAVMFERNPKKMRIIQDFYIFQKFKHNK